MSLVTDAVIFVGYAPDAVLKAIAEDNHDKREGARQTFAPIGMEYAGGSKVFQSDLYAAGFNYVSGDDLEEWFTSLPWGDYATAVLVWSTEGDSQGKQVIARGAAVNWTDVNTNPWGGR